MTGTVPDRIRCHRAHLAVRQDATGLSQSLYSLTAGDAFVLRMIAHPPVFIQFEIPLNGYTSGFCPTEKFRCHRNDTCAQRQPTF